MSGQVGHFEIPADDVERAQKFYSQVFGWRMTPMPDLKYTMVGTTESNEEGMPTEPGAINGGLVERGEVLQHPTLTLIVDDIEVVGQAIAENGGTNIVKKTPIGDGSMGYVGYFKDSEGNVVGLFQRGKA